MGTLACIVFAQDTRRWMFGDSDYKDPLYLSTSSNGDKLPRLLQAALGRSQAHWYDEGILACAIFRGIVQDDDGVSPRYRMSTYIDVDEDSRPLLVVDSDSQTVGLAYAREERNCYRRWSFEEFIAMNIEVDGWPECPEWHGTYSSQSPGQ